MRDGCVFCDYEGPSPVLTEGYVPSYDALGVRNEHRYFVIEPLDPVTPGHLLVIPREHVTDLRFGWPLLGATMEAAARVAAHATSGCNLITSAGTAATQTIMHLHVHMVPRRFGDGLALPWDPPRRVVAPAEDWFCRCREPAPTSTYAYVYVLRPARMPECYVCGMVAPWADVRDA